MTQSSTEPHTNTKDEEITDTIGSIGLWQAGIFASNFYLQFVVAIISVSTPFLVPDVHFMCQQPHQEQNLTRNSNHSYVLLEDGCSTSYQGRNISCETFVYEHKIFHYTYTEKFNLVCEKEWLLSFCSAVTLFGDFLACFIYSVISDKFGRRRALLSIIPPPMIGAVLTLLAPNVPLFLLGRFLQGVGAHGSSTTSYVLLMEVSGKRYRSMLTGLSLIGFISGGLFTGTVTYFLMDSFKIQICFCIMNVLIIPAIIFLPESPRWLLLSKHENKIEMTKNVLQKAAKWNSKTLCTQNIDAVLTRIMVQEQHAAEVKYGVLDLFRGQNMKWKTLAFAMIWTISLFISNGIILNSAIFGSHQIVTFLIILGIDLPSCPLMTYLVKLRGSKQICVCVSILSLAVYIFTAAMQIEEGQYVIVIVVLLKIFSVGQLVSCQNWTAEVFPTVVRSSGVGLCVALGRFAALFSPFLKEMARLTGLKGVFLLMGSLTLISLMWIMILPNTHGSHYPETLEDGEKVPIVMPWRRNSCLKTRLQLQKDKQNASSVPEFA